MSLSSLRCSYFHIPQRRTAWYARDAARIFNTNGCVVIPNFFRPDVADVRSAYTALIDEPRLGRLVPDNPRLQLDMAGGNNVIRKVEPFLDLSPELDRLVRAPVQDLVSSLLGEPVALFEDKANCKQARGGSAFPWHQDLFYWSKFSPELISVFICVDDCTVENGCLEVVCGAPATAGAAQGPMPLLPHRVGPVESGADDQQLDPEQLWGPPIKVPAAAGDVIIFSSLTPHRSAPNGSAGDRRALLLSFNPARLGDWYEGKRAGDGGGGELRGLSDAYVHAHAAGDEEALGDIRRAVAAVEHRRPAQSRALATETSTGLRTV